MQRAGKIRLGARVLLGLALFAGRLLFAGDSTGLIVRDPDSRILFLSVMPSKQEGVSDDGKPLIILDGEFLRKDWALSFGGTLVAPSVDGVFQLRIPIQHERIALDFVARGPGAKVEKESMEVIVLNWEAVRRKIEAAAAADPTALRTFRVYSLTSAQQVGGFTSSAGISWNPSHRLNATFRVCGNAALFALNKVGGSFFLAAEYGLILAMPSEGLLQIEAGGGGQTWFGYGGTRPVASLTPVLRLDAPLASWARLESFFAGYTAVFDKIYTSQIKVGLTLRF